uniref:Uncharacterized protein n=1 Tax=Rhizophora mucronata TaxID=61149 RepID=A0A2P2N451_RHIMU
MYLMMLLFIRVMHINSNSMLNVLGINK